MHPILQKFLPSSYAVSSNSASNSTTSPSSITTQTSTSHKYVLMKSDPNSNYDDETQINSPATTTTTTTTVTNATKKSKKKNRKKHSSDLNLLYRLMHFKMPMIVLSVATTLLVPVLCEPTVQKPTYIVESNKNPYTSYSNRANSKQQLSPSASELKPQFASTAFNSNINHNNNNRTSFIRRSPQFPSNVQYSYKPSANSHVLFGVGRQASAVVENLTTAESTLRKEKRQILVQEPEPTVQQQAEDASRHYQCDSIIHDANFQIESPHYPAMYPINRICSYYVARSRQDVCQIEVTISDMDIEDTPQCTADYLDLGGGQQERLCGLMLRNSKRLIMFPSNGSYIRITFHSDSQNSRPYRGFSADVRQLSNSCFYPYHGVANGTQQQVIHTVYGQRLYPPTTRAPPTVYFGGPPPAGTYIPGITPPGNGQPGQLYPPYLVNTKSPGGQTTIVVQQPNQQPGTVSFNVIPRQQPNNNNTPIYLASYCDVYLGEVNGELRSPGYPFGYPTNHSCIYTVKKAFDDVCQLELIFHHFDIQTPDSKKDLTDTCHGDYLELPDHSRLCGYYNQAMSREHVLKKFYLFPDQSDYLFLQFVSDQNQTPDGSGFWIESKQLRNTCVDGVGGVMPVRTNQVKCDREIIGKYSNTDRVYSPNFPNLYPARAQCVYFIQPADSRTCEFELDLVQFQLEDVRPTNSIQELGQCTKDFLQLPDRTRICGRTNFRKIFNFPKYHDRTAMFYFTSDEQIQERGFEIVVRQIPNTCSNFTGQSGSNQNVYVINDPNIRYNPTPVYTYHNASGIQPYNPLLPQQPPIITQVIPSSPTYVKIPGTKKITTNTNQLGPSYSIVPSVLNDPRNVDSSGTIPLYYANGTLATRIPPLKPVDMITFLKKGKTFGQKSGSSFVPGGGSFIGFDSSKQQQFGNLNQFNPSGNVNQFGGRSSNNQGMVTSSSNTFDLQPFQPQLQPTYNCDQVLSRNVEYIRSPNFPSNYPPVTRCIYTILKSENSVCQVRLQLLTMDMEYTAGCKNDYFQIETTGEKVCGRLSQPETRVINYYGHARDIRLIFNSDRQNTAQGFEVRIEQMPNSCDGAGGGGGQNASLASMVGAARTFTPQDLPTTRSGRIAPISNQFQPTPSTELDTSRFPIPQALVTPSGFPNRSAPLQALPPVSGTRICRTSALMDTYFESDNFPNPYPTNTDCVYKIFRANRNVCRLEIELLEFDVGNEIFDSSANGNSLPMSSVITTCPNDFLEIDQVKYCGRRPLQKIAVNFPRMIGEISFRFLTVSPDPFNGFRLKIRQIDENCRQSTLGTFDSASDPMSGDFSPATIESCPKLSDPTTGSTVGTSSINEEVVRIQSPKFGLLTNLGYEPFLDCHYLVQKSSPSVCALEIRFESFSLEESRSCTKDYLEINGNGLKLCGKMPIDTIRTFDFASNSIRMHFHTDADRNDTGFAMILKQIRC